MMYQQIMYNNQMLYYQILMNQQTHQNDTIYGDSQSDLTNKLNYINQNNSYQEEESSNIVGILIAISITILLFIIGIVIYNKYYK